MSDDKNLDSNHFCAPVDEFEKFQADSMYEEEDFITLSDIVPPQPPVPDLSNELIEIPYDNEVILSSTQNDIQQCGISAEDHTLENKSLAQALDTAGNGAETLDSTSTSKAPARSGRKRGVKRNQKFRKKQTYNNSEKHEKESLNKNYLGVQDSVHSTTADKTDTESRLDTSSATNIPRRTSRERIPNTVRYPLVTETQLSQVNPVKRRPGRPKKIHAENQSNSEPDSTNPENNSISNDSSNTPECSGLHLHNTAKTCDLENGSYKLTNINNSVTTESESDISSKDVNKDTKKRRGRKKKVVASVPINKDEDLETLNGDKTLPESSENSQLSDSIKHFPNKPTDSSKKVIDTGSLNKAEESFIEQDNIDVENDNDADDICLSKLKQSFDTSVNTDNITTNIVQDENNECKNDNASKRASKVPEKEDLKYNIEDVIKETSKTDQLNLLENDVNESLLIEDISKRPIRRKVKQTFKYDSESEEDPYANVELSDDDGEPRSRKKGRYYSDDEYVPGGRRGKPSSSSSDSDIELDDEDLEGKKRRKKITKNTDSQTPKKRGRKRILEKETESDVNVINVEDKALEESSKPSLTVTDETLSMKPPAEAWATSNEFENFIAKKIQGTSVKIQKVTSKTKTQSTPLEIPVLDQNEPKKTVVKSTQTTNNPTTSTGIQTSVPYDIPMKNNINLTSEQSEKACEFLNSVVKTTSELGQLMKDKSEDFMKKKINTGHVTDTFKMDYCVRKSFLLFKLARHNLMQMEEDLAKQYDEFLKNNDLSSCREEVKNIIPKPKSNPKADSDSDCEIVEVKESSKTSKKSEKPKFNAKTVFLNKELSIKIAKKPSAEKKLNIEGRQYVWINDSVMVKKVKPTQSFLAQDSRNKKPPDSVYNITEKIVSDFFDNYYRQKALTVCAPFVTTEWSSLRKEYACHYFVASENLEGANRVRNNEANLNNIENSASTSIENYNYVLMHDITRTVNPKSLTTLCVEVVRNNMCYLNLSKTELAYNITEEEENEKKQPLSLFRLCYKNISQGLQVNKIDNENIDNTAMTSIIPSLKTLCYRSITSLLFDAMGKGSFTSLEEDITEDNERINEWRQDDVRSEESDSCEDLCAFISNEIVSKETNKTLYSSGHTTGNTKLLCHLNNVNPSQEKNILNGIKSLSSLCLNSIQLLLKNTNSSITPLQPEFQSPKTLKYLAYESIRHIICDNKIIVSIDEHSPISNEEPIFENESGKDFAINCINTLTEEAFSNLQETDEFRDDDDDYYEPNTGFDADHEDENEWAAQVQMQELRSCVTPIENTNINENDSAAIDNSGILEYNFAECELDGLNNINDDQCRETLQDGPVCDSLTPQIKQEPLDEIPESQVDSSVVKTEPIHGFHGMTIIPESIVTKSEMTEDIEPDVVSNSEPISTTFDRDSFEHFVRANKMVRSMDEFSDDDFNNVFSQSASRVRREHEPDPEAGTDMNMGLLVPQTYEPLPVETVKDSLMESSSDDGKDNTTKKASKKKTDKKARGKLKKGKDLTKNGNKETTIKEVTTPVKIATLVKEKQQCSTEIAILTRKMREKIRQEEKKVESSESESENAPLSTQKGKNKKGLEKSSTQIDISKHVEEPSNHKKDMNIEIQCNSVDSTAQIIEKDDMDRNKFSGFSAIDQNEITTYQKYMKFVYERIIPQDEEKNNSVTSVNVNPNLESNQTRSDSPVITPDQPVEILECEPTLPLCLQDGKTNTVSKPKKASRKKEKEQEILDINKSTFTEQDGWHCYPINSNDKKLYSYCEIPLRKLPESFVETYLEYHDITERDNHDKEVDRLVNLNTLNRSSVKSKKRLKDKKSGSESVSLSNSRNVSRSASPANSEHYDELTPSEDESPNIEDEIPPPVPVRATENSMAKNSLMDDHESDSDSVTPNKSKNLEDEQQPPQIQEKRKCGPKSKTKIDKSKELPMSESVMLTADKMMNKELTLLHAPVTLKQELNDNPIVKEPSPKDETKMRTTRSKRKELKKTLKTEDDSSSEEEKQWVTTKEKLLKRLGKKEDVSVDDAKRAKLVTDFIEKHGGAPGKRRAAVTGGRRSRRKRLEQQKQLRVLSKELFGEPTGGKRGAVKGLFTGRRNIRKVIDKKSLQRSTVLANMEEFERKRRLNARQTMLRELHGCEEGVNVLVINDEVCLEYDFNEHRPVVTVHPFFTKVMKAHQYEGVKFMWDACFESLSCIEAGHAGGGCILAHCMGLGKTLQVLALLHTVLTHPRVGMQRVLVCCPLSTVLNWVDEIHKWIGPVTDQIKVFELSKLKKTYERAYQLEDWYNGGGIFIIGYELFRSLTTLDPVIDDVRITIINKIRTALLDPGPDIIICDEGHLLKNDCSVLAVAMSRVVTKRRIILTGTPMQNNLREYYCMVNFVKPDLLGTYSEYSNRFENPIMNGQHRDSQEEDIKLMKARTHILHKVLEGCLQRQEASVLYPYLPKKHEYTVFIPLTKCQWDLYKHYVHHYTKKSKQSVLKDFHILQKIWSHPQVLHNFQIKARDNAKKKDVKLEKVEDDLALEDNEDLKPPDTETWWLQYVADGAMLNTLESSNKFIAVFRILNECISLGDKVLIFSTSLFCLDALEYFLQTMNGWNLGQEYYRLDGSVPPEVRQKWCREFNAENNVKTKLFLISTRAGCLGLNMTAANRVIILDTSWNPAHDIQSIFRVYRFGQKKDCYIYRLVAMGTMEQKIYERAVTKQAVACRVVDEQQIDRHYNMAELTELYRFDEAGASVAGGVAVGVSDVALLRVARDEPRAVHAVHEHDSLLRGSAEPNLPEHERAAAWTQFQQEHAHRQMQNDLDANKAALAQQKVEERLKKEEERLKKEEERLKREEERQQSQVHKIKTEEGPIHDPSLIPQPGDLTVKDPQKEPMRGKKYNVRGRGKKGKTVQCRIPIKTNQERAGPSQEEVEPILEHDDDVREITNLLIKYNFTKPSTGAQEICELVASVKKMVQTGNPVNLGKGSDELTASIASVLMKRQASLKRSEDAPPAVDSGPEPVQQRPKSKSWQANLPDAPLPIEETGRPRRLAAISAEKSFEKASELNDDMSQDSEPNADEVIQLDDDWIASDTDSVLETPVRKPASPVKKFPGCKPGPKSKKKLGDSSIVLSDDETPSTPATSDATPASKLLEKLYPNIPISRKSNAGKVAEEKPTIGKLKEALEKPATAPTVKPDPGSKEEPVALHPSLLTNQNFIMLVAHTYLAGNPMLDEDAATLAAQYSTFKALKEFQTTGKPIDSGPIYDIAIQVFGKENMKKLHEKAHPISSSTSDNVTIPKLLQNLRQQKPGDENNTGPSAPVANKLIGPKSRVTKNNAVQAPEVPKPQQQQMPSVVPIGLVRTSDPPAASPAPREECILPDDEVECVTPPVDRFKLKPKSLSSLKPIVADQKTVKFFKLVKPQSAPVRVSAGASASASYATICLDSDEEDAPPAAPAFTPHVRSHALQLPQFPSAAGACPVPVALTGPNSQPIPLTLTAPPARAPPPAPQPRAEPVPVSLVGPDARFVPITLAGPGLQSYPISLTGPDGRQTSIASARPGIVVSVPSAMPAAPAPASAPAPSAPVIVRVPTSQPAGSVAEHLSSNVYLVPMSRSEPVVVSGGLTRLTASQVPTAVRVQASQVQVPGVAPSNRTYLQPGMRLQLDRHGRAVLLPADEIHVIPDETTASIATTSTAPSAKPSHVAATSALAKTAAPVRPQTSNTSARQPPPKASTPPQTKSPDRIRKVSSSSSGDSDSSRASSPSDPLSILKDVVHIQAPERRQPRSTAADRNKPPVKTTRSTTNKSVPNKSAPNNPTETTLADIRKSDISEKFSKIIASVKKRVSESASVAAPGKTIVKIKPPVNAKQFQGQIKDTVDLTDQPSKAGVVKAASQRAGKSAQITKKDVRATVVGTSKNIILDGKSKSLTNMSLVDLTGQNKNVNVTNVKTINIKAEKRAAPPPEIRTKKKKTELMTLKDFDIDDIDDIIELD